MPSVLIRLLFALLLFLTLVPHEANADACTDGNDCFCDCATSPGTQGTYKNASCQARLVPRQSGVIWCEDWEAVTLHDGRGTGTLGLTGPSNCTEGNPTANCANNTSSPLFGPPYQDAPGADPVANPHVRAKGWYFPKNYGSTSATRVGIAGGVPASPTYGYTCPNAITCYQGEWRGDNAWGENNYGVVDIVATGEFDDENNDELAPLMPNGSRGMYGNQVFAQRNMATPLHSGIGTAGISGTTGTGGLNGTDGTWPSWGNLTHLGVTFIVAYSTHYKDEGIWDTYQKTDEFGAGADQLVMGKGGSCDSGERAPFCGFIFATNTSIAAAENATATINHGVLSSIVTSAPLGVWRWRAHDDDYRQSRDWPDLNKWACITSDLNRTTGSIKTIVDFGDGVQHSILDISGVDFDSFSIAGAGLLNSWMFNNYSNAIGGANGDGTPDGIQTTRSVRKFEDNMIAVKDRAPVPCSQLGFTTEAAPTTPIISVSPVILSPSVTADSNATAQTFIVQNVGSGTLSYAISDNVSWLSVSPTPGTSTGEADTINVTYSTAGLAAGSYSATITVTAAAAVPTTQTITVNLTVNPAITLTLDSIAPTPASGVAPLTVLLTYTLSGTATGDVILAADCDNNGTYEASFTDTGSPWVFANACTFATIGIKTIPVRITRGGISANSSTTVTVNPAAFSAGTPQLTPASGLAPVLGVDVAVPFSNNTGTVTMSIDCNGDGTYETSGGTSTTSPITKVNACDYPSQVGSPSSISVLLLDSTSNSTNSASLSVTENPAKWTTNIISSITGGLIDSPFLSYDSRRIYFTYSPKMLADFIAGTSTYPQGPSFAGAQGGADLYYIEWDGSAWSSPVNLGTNINTANHDVDPWVSKDELTLIFYRYDGASLRQNMISTRTTRTSAWGVPTILSGDYGTGNQTATQTRADIVVHEPTNEAFLWEHRDISVSNYAGRLGRGISSGPWAWNTPVYYTGAYDLIDVDETQPYISQDGLTLMWNRRPASWATSAPTTLWKATRANTSSNFTATPTQVTVSGLYTWGEVSADGQEQGFLAQAVDYGNLGYSTHLIHMVGTPASSSLSPPVVLNPFTTAAAPSIVVSNSTVSPSVLAGNNAPNDSFTVLNGALNGSTLSYSVSEGSSWLSVSPSSGTSTIEADVITITYNVAGLAVGNYSAVISIADAGSSPPASNTTQTITVNLTVNPTIPVIGLSTNAIAVATTVGITPAAGSFTVSNSGNGTISYSISDDVGWLSVSPTTGTVSTNSVTENITYNVTGLVAGVYNGTITITDAGSAVPPVPTFKTISVTLTVNNVGATGSLHCNVNGDQALSATAWNWATYSDGWTWEAMIKLDSAVDGWKRAISTNAGDPNSSAWFAEDTGGKTRFEVQNSVANGVISSQPGTGVITNETSWHRYTLTFSGGVYTIYIDGAQVGQSTGKSNPGAASNGAIRLCDAYLDNATLNGRIADVRLLSAAKNSTWIGQHKDCRLKPSTAGLVDYWRLDELTGTTAANTATTPTHGNLTISGGVQMDSAETPSLAGISGSDCANVLSVPSVSPVSITSTAPSGGVAVVQNIYVTNIGSGPMDYSLSDTATWITESPIIGTSTGEQDLIRVFLSPASLAAGVYTGSVRVTDDFTNAFIDIPITFTVTATAPTITFSPSSITAATIIQGNNPASQTFTVSNSGNSTLNYTISEGANWFSVSPASGTAVNGEVDTITITYNAIGLTAGTYTQNISIIDAAATNSPRTIPVSITVTPLNPLFTLSTSTLARSVAYGSNATSQSFTVTNSGNGTLNYTITDNQPWLSVSPASGSSTGEADTISVTYDTSGLAPGTYTGVITLASPISGNGPKTVTVTLTVLPPVGTLIFAPAYVTP